MAGSIKGITVELNGNATNLTKAINDAKKSCNAIGNELKTVDRLLKLDPGNFTLTKQKADLLAQSIQKTRDSLSQMEAAQEQVERKFAAGEIGEAQYRKFNQELVNARERLKGLEAEQKTVNGVFMQIPAVKAKYAELGAEIKKSESEIERLKDTQKEYDALYSAGKLDKGKYEELTASIKKATDEQLENIRSSREGQKELSNLGTSFTALKGKIEAVGKALAPVGAGLQKVGAVAGAGFKAGVTALKAYTTAAVAAGTGIVGITAAAGAAADDINTLSTVTGISTDQLQKYQYASDIIDVSVETIAKSNAKLIKSMNSARDGSGDTAEAFKTLGVSVTDADGNLRDSQEVFNEAITALGNVENETERDALSMQIFGKSAQDLNPLIEGGADALALLGENAEEAGLILSQDALNALNDYNDANDTLKANATAAGRVLAGVFAPSLATATSAVAEALPQMANLVGELFNGGDMAAAGDGITSLITDLGGKALAAAQENLPTILEGFNTLILSIVEGLAALLPEAADGLLGPLIDALVGLVSGLVEQLPTLLPALVEGAAALFTGIVQGFTEIIPQVIEILPELITQVCSALAENAPAILDAIIALVVGVAGAIITNFPQILSAVVSGLGQILAAIGSYAAQFIQPIIQFVAQFAANALQAGAQFLANLGAGLSAAVSTAGSILASIISAVASFVGNMASKAAEAASGFCTALITGLANVVSQMVEVGSNIVHGIWQGISSGWSWLTDQVKHIAGGLIDAAKGALGIHSPSTKFRDIIGKNMAAGIGIGFTEQMKAVRRDMERAIPTNFAANVTAATRAADNRAAGALSAAGLVVNVTNNSPKALTDAEAARLTRTTMRQVLLNIKGGAVS